MAKLIPCPFCGKSVADCMTAADAEMIDEDNELYDLWTHYFVVVCRFDYGGCGSSTGGHPTAEEAIQAWNRRNEDE